MNRIMMTLVLLTATTSVVMGQATPAYRIVDTRQARCYNSESEIAYPTADASFFGQDAQYTGHVPSYRSHKNGTVTDLNTGLMWQADPGDKKTYAQAVAGARSCRTGGYKDWRLPTTKELYSLICFDGLDSGPEVTSTRQRRPFIDTTVFKFKYGDPAQNERIIDSQWATSTRYAGRVMHGQKAMFGVNFADGRIKGYPTESTHRRRGAKKFYVIYVRGNPRYGKNDFVDNKDGTITDRATELTWMTVDSAALKAGPRNDGKMNWQESLAWAEQLKYAGHNDWRMPNAKELHSLVDYSRNPDTTNSPAIDPVFKSTPITNEGGKIDYAHYWTGTTHARPSAGVGGVYIAFGRALGYMPTRPGGTKKQLLDVHGAGAQRSDPKSGDPKSTPTGRGPQGDVVRIYNLIRCVRGGLATPRTSGPSIRRVQRSRRSSKRTRTTKRPKQSSSQQQNGPPSRSGPPSFVGRLDRDGDKKVSREEFDGPKHHFDTLDRDNDGFLSEDEAPSHPPRRRGTPPSRPTE